ncbi:hypothetical protein P3342_010290 [Pyrenophora teres f. teres]|nr:hypothetical protein P3342_010290 [Pyrenophora teres f. teres]
MQAYKITRGKTNSKACDQCYRCKVKCTMEPSGCTRCRMTDGLCTYSLGKWMGRPKKSSRQTSQAKSREVRSCGSASPEPDRSYSDQTINLPDSQQCWELLPSATEEPMRYPLEHTAVSPFSMDDYAQFKAEGYYASTNESQSTTTSDKRASPRPISHNRTLSREMLQRDMDTVSTASLREDRQGNYSNHRGDSCPSLKTPQSLGSHLDFNFGNMGMELSTSPRASLAATIEMHAVDCAKGLDVGQACSIMRDESTSPVEESCHCTCSQSALACLDKISTVSPEARYIDRLEAIQSALLTAEKLVLCTNCPPNMIIAKCCLTLGNAHELISDMSSELSTGRCNEPRYGSYPSIN